MTSITPESDPVLRQYGYVRVTVSGAAPAASGSFALRLEPSWRVPLPFRVGSAIDATLVDHPAGPSNCNDLVVRAANGELMMAVSCAGNPQAVAPGWTFALGARAGSSALGGTLYRVRVGVPGRVSALDLAPHAWHGVQTADGRWAVLAGVERPPAGMSDAVTMRRFALVRVP